MSRSWDTSTRYWAMQRTGKAHRIAEGDAASLCGITLDGMHHLFPEAEVPEEDRCRRCWRPSPPQPTQAQTEAARFATTTEATSIEEHERQLVDDYVTRATDAYRHGAPGHGEFLLTRLGMRLTRLAEVRAARDADARP